MVPAETRLIWQVSLKRERLDPHVKNTSFFPDPHVQECYLMFRNHRFKNVTLCSGFHITRNVTFCSISPQIRTVKKMLPFSLDSHSLECYNLFLLLTQKRMIPFAPNSESQGCYLLFLSVLLEPLQRSVLHHSLLLILLFWPYAVQLTLLKNFPSQHRIIGKTFF